MRAGGWGHDHHRTAICQVVQGMLKHGPRALPKPAMYSRPTAEVEASQQDGDLAKYGAGPGHCNPAFEIEGNESRNNLKNEALRGPMRALEWWIDKTQQELKTGGCRTIGGHTECCC